MKKQGDGEAQTFHTAATSPTPPREALLQFAHQLLPGTSPLAWHLRFLRAKAPVDKLSVERHSVNEGGEGREGT